MTDTEPKPRRKITREVATTLLDITGGLSIAGGIAAIYWPAALIFGGALLVLVSWRLSR